MRELAHAHPKAIAVLLTRIFFLEAVMNEENC